VSFDEGILSTGARSYRHRDGLLESAAADGAWSPLAEGIVELRFEPLVDGVWQDDPVFDRAGAVRITLRAREGDQERTVSSVVRFRNLASPGT
jgi:hypothetical protein